MPRERQELMLRIIDLCDSVRLRGLDPFDVRVREFFDRLQELLPKIKKHEDLYLDIQAVLGLADVVFQQEEWIKHKSSMFYLDPLLISLKLHALPPEELAEVLVRSWHPLLELEALSPSGIRESKDYWTALPPFGERRRGLDTTEVLPGEISRGELERMGVISKEELMEVIERAWKELLEEAGERGEISYWDFVVEKTFEKTIKKAWLVSFLVTYGYATVEVKPLEEKILLKPLGKPEAGGGTVHSVPISITRDEWERRVKGGES